MKEKIYKNKEWLINQVEVLGKSIKQIAKECNVATGTIYYWYNDKIKNRQTEYSKENKEKRKIYGKEWRGNNKEKLQKVHKLYEQDNKEKLKIRRKNRRKIIKIQAFNILGGCKCVICGDEELSHLTIDHIDNTGYLDKKEKLYSYQLYFSIISEKYPTEKLSNLRVLCWNCNFSRFRNYLSFSLEEQTYSQKHQTELWKKAYDFFGPCKICGDNDLTHLTISHINNDGAEKRRNGEKVGVGLISKFCKQKWEESLKENYCLECANCNCSRIGGD